MKRILVTIFFIVFSVTAYAQYGAQYEAPDDEAQKQIDFFTTLGLIRYGSQVDASGSRTLLVLQRDNTGVFSHQYLHDDEGTDIEKVLESRGLISYKVNKKTGSVEKHVMVFNPKDKNTYVWIPLSEARETAQRIKDTGKTLLEEPVRRRMGEKDMSSFNWNTSF